MKANTISTLNYLGHPVSIPNSTTSSPSSGKSHFMHLPAELVDSILDLLTPVDLASLSQVCHALRRYANEDSRWHRLVQSNVPEVAVSTCYPFKTFRDLYAAHEPFWFLTRYKIWFCDHNLMGKMMVVRYDQRRGCIEGYLLLAENQDGGLGHWPADPKVIIHKFEPVVRLHLDKPILKLHPRDCHRRVRFTPEVPLDLDGILQCNLMLSSPLHPSHQPSPAAWAPSYGVWPPPAVPAAQRTASTAPYGPADPQIYTIPSCRADAADRFFRIRQWIEHVAPSLSGSSRRHNDGSPAEINGQPLNPLPPAGTHPYGPVGLLGTSIFPAVVRQRRGEDGNTTTTGPVIGEEVVTYATIDPALYTPTPEKPWRGIWVGDYCGHGSEFLLIHQPDDPPQMAPLEPQRLHETDEEFDARRKYRGRLEAIKLTGDANVPRGEYTFIADDLGEGGFVADSNDPPFIGRRIVRSKGHIAGTGFVNGKTQPLGFFYFFIF